MQIHIIARKTQTHAANKLDVRDESNLEKVLWTQSRVLVPTHALCTEAQTLCSPVVWAITDGGSGYSYTHGDPSCLLGWQDLSTMMESERWVRWHMLEKLSDWNDLNQERPFVEITHKFHSSSTLSRRNNRVKTFQVSPLYTCTCNCVCKWCMRVR